MPTSVRPRVDICILEPFKGRVSRSWLRNIACQTLRRVLPGESCQLSVVIADDATLKRLNRDYRGLDEVTDVLSFSASHNGHWEGAGEGPDQAGDHLPFITPPDEPKDLGEVIISYPQASLQAGGQPLALEKELALLVVHGVLHLLGFDHEEPLEQANMQAKEQEILSHTVP